MAGNKRKLTCGGILLASFIVLSGLVISVGSLNPAPLVLSFIIVIYYFNKKS